MKPEDFRRRAEALGPEENVEATADRLERMHWNPELLEDVEDFLRLSRKRLAAEIDRLLLLDARECARLFGHLSLDPRRAALTQASLLLNAAELLWRLRSDEPEAWDQINELYEDD